MSAAFAITSRHRTAGIIIAAVLASAMLLAIFVARGSAGGLGDQIRRSLTPFRTLAAMIAERSPGDRPEGALASLKHKKQFVLSEHVAPTVPGKPLAALLSAPPEFVAPPVAGPFYSLLGTPGVVVPPVETAGLVPPIGGSPGIIVPAEVGGGGGGGGGGSGGGGGVSPPVTTQPTIVTTTSGVPEPSSWALMLLGFGLVGGALRRQRAAAVSIKRT